MKRNLLFGALGVVCTTLGAQTVVFSENFDTYTAGNAVVQTTTETFWDTWSSNPGSAEDSKVSDLMAVSGANSMNVLANEDMVLLLEDKTAGRYQVEFEINVATGKSAYFNFLQDFAGAGSQWGMQITFNTNGTGTIDAGGAEAATFNYNQGEWIHVNGIVDLDDDFATLYVGNSELVSWGWTGGSFGDGTTTKLDAVNFYGIADADFYVDDIVFTEQVTVEAPSNLMTSLTNNDITVTWDAPTTTPESYLLERNSAGYQAGLMTLTYGDNGVFPGVYIYAVRAHYPELGYSALSNTSEETIEGGTERNAVLVEVSTGTWCPNCPGAAMGADDLHDNGENVAVIEYHNGDDYVTTNGTARIESYYGVTGFPTTSFDGLNEVVGGNQTTSMLPTFQPLYDDRMAIPALYSLSMTIVPVSGNSGNDYTVTIEGEELSSLVSGNFVLRTALTESNIPENWIGMTDVDFVERQMLPSAAGITLDFTSQATFTETMTLTMDPSYVHENCEFIAFIQNDDTKEVMQTEVIRMETIAVSVVDENFTDFAFYPNPATDKLLVRGEGLETINVLNQAGQIVKSISVTSMNETINLDGIANGMYILQVKKGDHTLNKKFVIE